MKTEHDNLETNATVVYKNWNHFELFLNWYLWFKIFWRNCVLYKTNKPFNN